MSNLKITAGGNIEADASRRFVDAWHRAETGPACEERPLAFESWETLSAVLTAKRMELLRHVRKNPTASVRALAKALGRGYGNVHADVRALIEAGLLDSQNNAIRADYDAIETKIAI